MSAILPTGITSLNDCPYPLHDAIRTGMAFLKFQEMSDDEAPPKRIWLDGDAITEHFKEVTRKMKAQYGNPDSSSETTEERNGAASMLLVE